MTESHPIPETSATLESETESTVSDAQGVVSELEELKQVIAHHQDQMLRLQAEMENVRRRAQDDVSKARKFAIESFAESLVPVRDSLEAALGQAEQSMETMREGVETTLRQISAAFDRHYLKEVDPQAGEKFDPNVHQAISSIPSEHPANTVVQRLQKGYVIADRTLRPALVVVSSGVTA